MIRAFAALALPDSHRQQLAGYLEGCAAAHPGFRWVPAASLHLTLRFAGNLEEEACDRLRTELHRIRHQSFEVRLGELGSFGGRLASVIWIGLAEGREPAAELAAACELACRAAGLAPEERPFRPHVTLARARSRRGEPAVELAPLPELAAWRAESFVLYRSRLGGGPPVYEPLETYSLG
ncbi:MAG TPA: RNA 2',3'-cyclic phosphodiesterase [Candidatus Dormibacteraeota bacterium]